MLSIFLSRESSNISIGVECVIVLLGMRFVGDKVRGYEGKRADGGWKALF